MTDSIKNKIAQKIKEENITPEPRWQIQGEKMFYFAAASLASILAGLLFSFVVLHIVQFMIPGPGNPGGHTGTGRPPHVALYIFPYLHLLVALLCVGLAVYVLRKTPKGHRYQVGFLSLAGAIVVFVVATVFHMSHINERAENMFAGRGPAVFDRLAEGQWARPEKGVLGGKVESIAEESFTVRVPQGEVWTVILDKDTVLYGKDRLSFGNQVFIEGSKEGEYIFVARRVKILEKRRKDNQVRMHQENEIPKKEMREGSKMQTF